MLLPSFTGTRVPAFGVRAGGAGRPPGPSARLPPVPRAARRRGTPRRPGRRTAARRAARTAFAVVVPPTATVTCGAVLARFIALPFLAKARSSIRAHHGGSRTPGEDRHDHADTVRPSHRHIGVRPDAAEPTAAHRRGERMAAVMGDGPTLRAIRRTRPPVTTTSKAAAPVVMASHEGDRAVRKDVLPHLGERGGRLPPSSVSAGAATHALLVSFGGLGRVRIGLGEWVAESAKPRSRAGERDARVGDQRGLIVITPLSLLASMAAAASRDWSTLTLTSPIVLSVSTR